MTTPAIDIEQLKTAITYTRLPAGGPGGGQFTFGPARNPQAAAAQKNPRAQQLYQQTLGLPPGQRASFMGGLSTADLAALARIMYSYRSNDQNVVNARITIANELSNRGMSATNYGALGTGALAGKVSQKHGSAAAKKSRGSKKTSGSKKSSAATKQKAAQQKAAQRQQIAAQRAVVRQHAAQIQAQKQQQAAQAKAQRQKIAAQRAAVRQQAATARQQATTAKAQQTSQKQQLLAQNTARAQQLQQQRQKNLRMARTRVSRSPVAPLPASPGPTGP